MIPQKAIDLILLSEGIDQPAKWPGGASGITLGYGYDLGYEKTFAEDWGGLLTPAQIKVLRNALGKRGADAKRIARAFGGIKISRDGAMQVFMSKTLPKYEAQTFLAFPGVEKLPPLAFGALVSLIFNRGGRMDGDRMREKRAIRDAIKAHARGQMPRVECLRVIAQQLRSMKRLWVGKGLDGLLTRREAEAKLVEQAIA